MKKDPSTYVRSKFSPCVPNHRRIFTLWIRFLVPGAAKCRRDGVCLGRVDGKRREDRGRGLGGVAGDGGDKVNDVKVGLEGLKSEDCVVGADGDVAVYSGVSPTRAKLYLCQPQAHGLSQRCFPELSTATTDAMERFATGNTRTM